MIVHYLKYIVLWTDDCALRVINKLNAVTGSGTTEVDRKKVVAALQKQRKKLKRFGEAAKSERSQLKALSKDVLVKGTQISQEVFGALARVWEQDYVVLRVSSSLFYDCIHRSKLQISFDT